MALTEVLKVRTSKHLHHKIKQAAQREGLGESAYIRRILTLWHQPDAATLAIPENAAILADAREQYVTEGE